MPRSQKDSITKDRLLAAATEVFSTAGYANATVRAICRRAEVNIAAVNYHFGDKQGLYDEVLRTAFFNLAGGDPTDWGVPPEAAPVDMLRAFVKSMLSQLMGDEAGAAAYTKMIAREMVDPTDALDRLIEEGIRPQIEVLFGVVRELHGGEVDDRVVLRCTASVLGQCLFYYFAQAVITRTQMEALSAKNLDELSEHVTRFSLAAIRSLASSGANAP